MNLRVTRALGNLNMILASRKPLSLDRKRNTPNIAATVSLSFLIPIPPMTSDLSSSLLEVTAKLKQEEGVPLKNNKVDRKSRVNGTVWASWLVHCS